MGYIEQSIYISIGVGLVVYIVVSVYLIEWGKRI